MNKVYVTGVLAAAFIMLNGCSGVQLASQTKTATVEEVSPDTFTVNFCGNAYMSKPDMEKYAFQRAANLTLEKGFSYFIIVSRRDDSEICTLNPMRRPGAGPESPSDILSSSTAAPFVLPNITLTIKCFPEEGKIPENAIDAAQYLSENFPGLRE